jgi:serine/threonine protein kinase
MSPEQLTGSSVDERSDIFAIGVMAVEAGVALMLDKSSKI